MKIGIISTTTHYDWSGADVPWARLASHAVREGHEVFLAAHQRVAGSQKVADLRSQGLKVCSYAPFRPTRLYLFKERILSDLTGLRAFKPDVILLNAGSILDAFNIPSLLQFLNSFSGPKVLFCHFHSEFLKIGKPQELRAFLNTVRGIVFVSEHNRAALERDLAISFPEASVIRNTPTFQLQEQLACPSQNNGIRFACVARLEVFWKGYDILLAALSEKQWQDRNWMLDIYGEGPDEARIRDLIGSYGLGAKVTLKGYTRHVADVWRDHHALVLPSRGEGLSLAMLEAMMCGRPVIATDVGGCREVLEEGVTGFIAEDASEDALGRALERAWAVRSKWQAMGALAHQKAKELSAVGAEKQLLDYLVNIVRTAGH